MLSEHNNDDSLGLLHVEKACIHHLYGERRQRGRLLLLVNYPKRMKCGKTKIKLKSSHISGNVVVSESVYISRARARRMIGTKLTAFDMTDVFKLYIDRNHTITD